jgi:aryl-alcohol dehydrogenase-like predicted oxidoreductase
MRYRTLGKSPLQVSELCLGTMMFADQTDITEARRIVAHAHDNGVNFIDTADVYSLGKSEAMVGELLKGQRHGWVLATKVGNKMSERPNEAQYARSWVLRECDASLQRLGVDHVDISTCTATTTAWILKSRCVPSMRCWPPEKSATGA